MKRRVICAVLSATMASSLLFAGGTTAMAEEDKTEITVWSWDATVEAAIPAFEEANPDITVKFENVGSASEQYRAIDNALQAGTGFPDVAQFEYFAVPYFAVAQKLADLSALGAGDYAADYVEAAWNDVHFNDTLYAEAHGMKKNAHN